MKTPPYLKPGDKICIIASARKVSVEEIQPAIDILKSWGLEVTTGKNLFKRYNQFAGTDAERLADLQDTLDDPQIKAILFARGGYGTIRILGDAVFSSFAKNPKWIIGFSDITLLHQSIQNLGIACLHSPMAFNFAKVPDSVLNEIKNALFGNAYLIEAPKNNFNRSGDARGVLIGGNLSIVYAALAAGIEMDTENKILFLEDLDEYLYHIDRMMMSLKMAGKLSNLKGLIIGGMNDMRDNTKAFGFQNDNPFGKTAFEIIAEAVAEYDYPLCFDFPAGHIENNHPLILGREVELKVGEKSVLKFS